MFDIALTSLTLSEGLLLCMFGIVALVFTVFFISKR